jgi:hypothetical protein
MTKKIQIDRTTIKEHKILFFGSGLLILIGIILNIAYTKHYKHPFGEWVVLIAMSIALLGFTYYFSTREDNASVQPGIGRPAINLAWMFVGWLLFALVVYSTATIARTDRVENCIPGQNLSPEQTPQEWIDFYENCPGSNLLFDQPAKDYILQNRKKPFWLMDKSGYTSDPVGWWNWYTHDPVNPYQLTQGVQDTLYKTGFLPERLLPK